MMRSTIFISVLFITILFTGCSAPAPSPIEGLWVVKTVKAGEEENTPNARWVRFNPDHSQESGNGWFQHSTGTWDYDPETAQLTVVNTNTPDDLNEPFGITLEHDQMVWKRQEDGQEVTVILERSGKLPQTYGDRILGLWQLEAAEGNGPYLETGTEDMQPAFLFFRWDKRFDLRSNQGSFNGVYNVHGHKPEVELIPYGGQLQRNFWAIGYGEDTITLRLLNSDSTVTRTFRRAQRFPD